MNGGVRREIDEATREGCTKEFRQEVNTLTGISFPPAYFQCLEHLVASIHLMGRNIVVVIETGKRCHITRFDSSLLMPTRTVHGVIRCGGHAHDAKLYWRTPTTAIGSEEGSIEEGSLEPEE